jgi:acyl-coenzyme A synthetase/AMP-(fatty) acid ligase
MSGYWNLPEETKAAFIPHPEQSGILAYRTGDLVRLDIEGNYHFIGRSDAMVKSRGYRIELGEIETILYSHPDVREAAVIPIPDDELGNVLKAFIAGTADQDELIAFCRKCLPKYMVPDEFEFRANLPKTSTGKINKNHLWKIKLT